MEQYPDQEMIMQKYKMAVRNMRWRPVAFAYIFGSLFILYPATQFGPTSPPLIQWLGRASIAVGLLLMALSVLRALQIRSWPVLLVHATVLKKHQTSGLSVRYYLRLQPHQTALFEGNGLTPSYYSLEPELDYMVANIKPSVYFQTKEGETARFICVPKAKQIIERV
ncbi:hypothetical protein [Candidatus Leptofilum sp.]|uniref:hypothetical protein n=1 Tax=Candidatus Leptofilum sp. TaxID=3241576 RepID=UPI003B5B1177